MRGRRCSPTWIRIGRRTAKQGGKAYADPDAALKIRQLHLLYESVKKSGGTVITLPTSLSDGLGNTVGKER